MLNEYRTRLDAIDDRIVAALMERMDTVEAIGAWKREHHMDAYDAAREKVLLIGSAPKSLPSDATPSLRCIARS